MTKRGPWIVTCTGRSYWYIRRAIPEFPGVETAKDTKGKTRRFKTAAAAKAAIAVAHLQA